MTDITYDADVDAVYIAVGCGKVDRTEEISSVMSMPRAVLSELKLCLRARFWRPKTGKKQNPERSARQRRRVADWRRRSGSGNVFRRPSLHREQNCKMSLRVTCVETIQAVA